MLLVSTVYAQVYCPVLMSTVHKFSALYFDMLHFTFRLATLAYIGYMCIYYFVL